MPIVDTWDPTLPPDSENPTLGANRIRELKRALDERFANMGAKYPTGTDAASGRLTCGEQGTTGVLDLAYEADGDLAITLHDNTAAVDPSRVLIGTGFDGARDYTLEVERVECARLDVWEGIRLFGAPLVTAASSPYTVQDDDTVVFVTTSSGVVTINLPSGTALQNRLLFIKKTNAGANAVTILPFGGESIDGVASVTLSASGGEPGHPCVMLYSVAGGWLFLGSHEEGGIA